MNGLVWLAAVAAIFAALLRPTTAHRGVGCSPSARPSVRVTRDELDEFIADSMADPRFAAAFRRAERRTERPYDQDLEEEAVEGHDPNCAVCAESERRRLQAIYPDSLA